MIETKGAGVLQEWSPEELLANRTLMDGDRDLVANRSGATRLAPVSSSTSRTWRRTSSGCEQEQSREQAEL
ncbi:hypothetical protein GT204_10655 [Streptomyces sp. SID4919]|uniref:hypothetical protein n=1 Tax=unclassified Streptomyces TaxID=2593676 RepID=UPI000C07E253|nr:MULTISPECIES: hypothetical protein [unclassified Streptomyces]MYY09359.1 hypothetical protein [Streptomyces sp. SID4919]